MTSEAQQRVNPNSALHWLEAAVEVNGVSVKVPDTRIIPLDFMGSISILDGDPNPDGILWGDLDEAACDLGWPVFIRSDLSSAKHRGADSVKAEDADDVPAVVESIIRDAAMKSMQPAAFLVREWIDVDAEFSAFGGLPVGVEFRLFATPDDHLCTHYYWPEESIKKPSDPEWESLRDDAAAVEPPAVLSEVAREAATQANDGVSLADDTAWSVDFARDESGQWWLIDMALGRDSWHPDCESKELIEA